ncbi:MAG TPA: hypothetical protein VF590_01335 [Isosphaeraceae bacterium]
MPPPVVDLPAAAGTRHSGSEEGRMADDPVANRESPFDPWVRLARAVRAATDAKKLLLAALGLILMHAGWAGLDALLPGAAEASPPADMALPPSPFGSWLGPLGAAVDAAARAAEPARAIAAPWVALLTPGRGAAWSLHAALAALWAVLVWGPLGGAIARIAVAQAATEGRIGLGTALRYAAAKAPHLIGAPLSPFIGVGFFAGLCALLGLLYRIPGPVGATIAGILAFLPLMAGLVMALILLGLAVGWPLMIATIAAEGEDTFDALSRSYSYVYQRPARFAAYAALAWVLGALGLLVVGVFARAILALAAWGLSLGAPGARLLDLWQPRFVPLGRTAPAIAHAAWLDLVVLLARGWAYSYFWTAAAHIYLLLRHDVDGTPWHDLPTHGTPPGLGEVPGTAPGA